MSFPQKRITITFSKNTTNRKNTAKTTRSVIRLGYCGDAPFLEAARYRACASRRACICSRSCVRGPINRGFKCGSQQRDHNFVMPGKGNGLAGFLCWSFQYILRGPVVLYEVEIRRCEFFQAVPKISYHGDGL